jgi:hypothetical protein
MAIIQDAINDPTAQALQSASQQAQTPATTSSTSPTSNPNPSPAPAMQASTSNAMQTTPSPNATGPGALTLQPDQSVEGRIASILASNNPIIQMARTKALETANGRGLLNSSMAVQAGETAAAQAALPMAQSDLSAQTQYGLKGADIQSQYGLKGMDITNQQQLQQMQNENAKLLQTNNQAATAFNQAQVAIAQIEQNDHMDAQAKTQAIGFLQSNLATQLKTLQSTAGLNLGGQLMFAGYPGFDAQGNWVGFPQGQAEGIIGSAAGAPPTLGISAGRLGTPGAQVGNFEMA